MHPSYKMSAFNQSNCQLKINKIKPNHQIRNVMTSFHVKNSLLKQRINCKTFEKKNFNVHLKNIFSVEAQIAVTFCPSG